MTTKTATAPETTTPDDAATTAALARLEKGLLTPKSGLSALASAAQATRRSMLLADISSSMNTRIKRTPMEIVPTGERKIEGLRKVVAGLKTTHSFPLAAFGFSESPHVRLVDEGCELPEPQGMTPLAEAIDFGKYQGATHLVVVTDGQPDDQQAAFDAADAFGGTIDVFYIGDGKDHGATFSAELARRTGGTCNLASLTDPKQLMKGIAGLLGDGSDRLVHTL